MAFCSSSAGDSGLVAACFCAAFLSAVCFPLVLGAAAGVGADDCADRSAGNIAQQTDHRARTTMHRLLVLPGLYREPAVSSLFSSLSYRQSTRSAQETGSTRIPPDTV